MNYHAASLQQEQHRILASVLNGAAALGKAIALGAAMTAIVMATGTAYLTNPRLLWLGFLPACGIILLAGLFRPSLLLTTDWLKAKLRKPKGSAS